MRRRITQRNGTVEAFTDHLAPAHDDRPDWDFAGRLGLTREFQRTLHVGFIRRCHARMMA
jgi:hypothetical protein